MNNRQLFLFKDHHMELIDGEVPEPGQGQLRIKIRYNGICGSDLHFYHEGRLGNFVVGKPYVPGHEASGIVDKIGDGVSNFNVGDQVVPEPGIPCGKCKFCKNGRYNLCPDVRFLSEPGTNGTFCDYVIMPEHFVHHIPKGLSLEKAALAEPVAVSVQAVNENVS
ncbi:MAG: alcohol dehydrogenase catalytic domain-containing protein [Lachnospiraceae bacterium]|nr:alcohol dehydrogenase catalytic domain-containing protein [Lachnospiraceae bacterium]